MSGSVVDLLRESFNAVNSVQGLIIAFLATLMMRRYASVVYFSVLAIIVDQFVTIAFDRNWGRSIESVADDLWNSIIGLDATVVIIRFIGFMVIITVLYGLRSFFRRT